MNLFLKAKHWQIFIVNFAIPILLEIIIIVRMTMAIMQEQNMNPSVMTEYFGLLPFVFIPMMLTLYGWYWAVAVGLRHKLPADVLPGLWKFKLFLFFHIGYMALFCFYFFHMMANVIEDPMAADFSIFMVIIPLHLFGIFCIYYCMYWVAKTFKSVELQREALFSDYLAEFLLIWIFPVGIWFIQPKINKMVSED